MENSKYLDSIATNLNKKGFNVVIGTIFQRIEIWKSWYRGAVNDFHFYSERVGDKMREFERLTLNLPKKIVEDYSGYIWNEESKATATSEKVDKILQLVLEENNFTESFNDFIELTEALGSGAIVVYNSKDKVKMDFINGDNLVITRTDNRKVTGIVTFDTFYANDKEYTHVIAHDYVEGIYKIEHFLFTKDEKLDNATEEVDFTLIFSDEEIKEFTFNTENNSLMKLIVTDYAFFEYFSPSIKNNWDTESAYGISRFANAIDDFKKVDLTYDAGYREIRNGESKLFFDESIAREQVISTNFNSDGTPQLSHVTLFDYNNPNFLMAKGIKGENGKAIEVFSPQLRCDMLDVTLSKAINIATWKCGLGNEYYEVKGGMATATQVIMTDSKLWRNIVKSQNKYGEKLKRIMASAITLYGYILSGTYTSIDVDNEIEIKFDDSIIIDDEALKEEMLGLVDRNILPKYYYLTKFLGMTEEEAKALVLEAEEEANNGMGIAFSDSEDYVEEELDEEINN